MSSASGLSCSSSATVLVTAAAKQGLMSSAMVGLPPSRESTGSWLAR